MKKVSISEALEAAIRTNRMEGLEISPDGALMLERVKCGEVSLEEFEKAAIVMYKALGEGEDISYEAALLVVRS